MGKYSNYKLILKDLAIGTTDYSYELDSAYFKLINDEESDVKRGKLTADVKVTRSATAFEVVFKINGTVQVPCDRCLDDVAMEVATDNKLIVKFGAEYSEESDEIVVIPEDEGEINIAWFIYEFIILSLPMKHVHPAGQCNKAVSSKLKKHRSTIAGEDDEDMDEDFDDIDDDDAGDEGESDPRWDALKDLEN